MGIVHIPYYIQNHSKKVCSLYKRALRTLESYIHYRPRLRYEATLLRDRFDKNKNVNDNVKAQELLQEGEKELFIHMHPQPIKSANTIGGIAYGRDHITSDWLVDYWHPLEKAQYPDYFARREQRKKEFIEFYEKQYGKPSKEDLHH